MSPWRSDTLLEMLGFGVDYQKSQLSPTQLVEFRGFRINSIMLTISLPLDKVKGIRKECQKVLKNPDRRASSAPRETKCFDLGSIPSTPSLYIVTSKQ